MNCTNCEHYADGSCTWDHMYLDTDYADDCCDFIKQPENTD